MLQKCAVLLSLLAIALLACVIISCGSSSSSKPAPCTGSYTVVGDWQGTITSNSETDKLFGTIDSSGNAVFFDDLADIATLSPITGACSFSSTLTAYESAENGGAATASGTATGNVTSDSALNGSVTINSTANGFTFSSYPPLGTGAVTAVSATVGAEVEGQLTDDLILTLGGTSGNITFTGSDAGGCTFNGAFTQEGTNDLYSVSFAVGGNSSCEAGTLTGVGFESDSDLLDVNDNGSGTYVYAVITSGGSPFVVEILPSGSGSPNQTIRQHGNTNFSRIFGFEHRLQ